MGPKKNTRYEFGVIILKVRLIRIPVPCFLVAFFRR